MGWQALTTVALVGTERQTPPPVEDLPGGALAAQLEAGDREGALLGAAAIAAVARLAGHQPATSTEKADAAPEEEPLPRCGQRPAGLLLSMLNGRNAELLGEWLSVAAEKRRVVPPELLPEVLEYGLHHRDARQTVIAVAGERGAWLARQNSEWEYAVTARAAGAAEPSDAGRQADSREVWETGEAAERLALLSRLRRSDPAAARELVESTWQEDSADDRAMFLGRLRDGLSLADEPLLESALDDRRKEVRSQAAELLAPLPDSALSRRLHARSMPLLTVKRSFLGGEWVEVRLPDASDAAMARDGIDPKPPKGSGYGEKAWWLRQMLGRIAPAFWERALGRKPDQLVQAAVKNGEWRNLLLGGWTEAANRFADATWQEALMLNCLRHPEQTPIEAQREVRPDMRALSQERLEGLLMHLLASDRSVGPGELFDYLNRRHDPWSDAFSRQVVAVVFATIGNAKLHGERWVEAHQLMELASQRCPPRLAEEFGEEWARRPAAGANDYYRRAVDGFLQRLKLRWEIRTALSEEGA